MDRLLGLKENVIVGRLIPAGTGNVMARLKAIAAERDREIELAAEAAEEKARVARESEVAAENREEAQIA